MCREWTLFSARTLHRLAVGCDPIATVGYHHIVAPATHDRVTEVVSREHEVTEPGPVDAAAETLVGHRTVICEATLVAAVRSNEAELTAAQRRNSGQARTAEEDRLPTR